MPKPDSKSFPSWDDETARTLVGKYVLIGLDHLDRTGNLTGREELHGLIRVADANRGFCIELQGGRAGESYWVPPDVGVFRQAPRGEYRLRSTGEVVSDPDYLATWSRTVPNST